MLASMRREGTGRSNWIVPAILAFVVGVVGDLAGAPKRALAEITASSSAGATQEFAYENNKVYEFKVPQDGVYKLEAWGAQGGDATRDGVTASGGKGGYSYGEAFLRTGDSVWVVVGGRGATLAPYASGGVAGGYNGGGAAHQMSVTGDAWGSGGGATHFATVSGTLASIGTGGSASVILVAGGGGGAGKWADPTQEPTVNVGGAGGGVMGEDGSGYEKALGLGGTESAVGVSLDTYSGFVLGGFGKGSGRSSNVGNGGGGGWYGGGSGRACAASAGGGSGRVGGASTNVVTSGEEVVDAGTAEIVTGGVTRTIDIKNGATYLGTSNYGRAGDGYAKITFKETTIVIDASGGTFDEDKAFVSLALKAAQRVLAAGAPVHSRRRLLGWSASADSVALVNPDATVADVLVALGVASR